MSSQQWSVVGRASLSPDELAAARQLIATCDAQDGLRLKMSVYPRPLEADAAPSVFLAYDGADLAGCWSVDYDGGPEAEMCGAVLPAYRRRGIGRALFDAAHASLRQRGASSILLICEDGSAAGRAFVSAVHGAPRHKELHMERPADEPLPSLPSLPARPEVEVRPATRADAEALVRVMTRAFGDHEAGVRRRVNGEVDDPILPYLLISANGETVGSLKPYDLGGTVGIYAVGVLPEQQGHGYGKRLMLGALAWLAPRFPGKPFVLEVDPDNAQAIAVYERTGFVLTTTYGYYAA